MNYWYDQSCRITSSISVSMFHEMFHLKFIWIGDWWYRIDVHVMNERKLDQKLGTL